jgi:hypothetical protein
MITVVMTGLNKLTFVYKPQHKQMHPVKPQKFHAIYSPDEYYLPIQIT